MEIDITKSVKLVRALLCLRKIQPEMVAFQSGISLENLRAWLQGATNTLGAHSYVELFKFLGVDKQGLLKDRVHYWELDTGFSGQWSTMDLSILEWAGNLVHGCSILEIQHAKEGKSGWKRHRHFMIFNQGIRVVLSVQSILRDPPGISPELMPGTKWEEYGDQKIVMQADGLYWKSLKERSLTISEFDDMYTGDFLKYSWNQLRLVAREHGVTPAMITQWILNRKRPLLQKPSKTEKDLVKLPEAYGAEVEVADREAIDVEFIPSVVVIEETKPAKRTRKPSSTPRKSRKKTEAEIQKPQSEVVIDDIH